MMALEKEVQTYRDSLPSLLSEEGKFVLIHDGKVIGTFDNLCRRVERKLQALQA